MPEITVHEYGEMLPAKYDVRFAGKLFGMEAVAQALRPQGTAEQYLRSGTFRWIVAFGLGSGRCRGRTGVVTGRLPLLDCHSELLRRSAREHRQRVAAPALVQSGAIAQPTFALVLWVEVCGQRVAKLPALCTRMETGGDEIEFSLQSRRALDQVEDFGLGKLEFRSQATQICSMCERRCIIGRGNSYLLQLGNLIRQQGAMSGIEPLGRTLESHVLPVIHTDRHSVSG